MIFKAVFFIIIQSVFLYKIVRNLNKNTISLFDIGVLALIDVTVSIILIFPDILSYAASFVGIGRGVDLFIYLSIFVLFYFIFKIYHKLEKIREDITRLNRMIAIKEYETKKQKQENR